MKKNDLIRICILILTAAAIGGCASASGRSYSPATEAMAPVLSQDYSVEIYIESAQGFSAYTIELEYDPAIVKIFTIKPADFGGEPAGRSSSLSSYSSSSTMSNPSTYSSGRTNIMAFSTFKQAGPGKVKAAVVEFEPLRKGTSFVKATLVNLYDMDGRPVEGNVSLSKNELKSSN